MLTRAISIASPQAAARALAHLPRPFLLHAGTADARSRWSFFGADPFAVFQGDDYERGVALWRRLSAESPRLGDGPPFQAGVVGAWSYDFGRRLERWPTKAVDETRLPDVTLAFHDVIGAHDRLTGLTTLHSSGLPLEGAHRTRRAEQRLERFARLLAGSMREPLRLPARDPRPTPLASTFSPDGYRRAVERVREHIRCGDIFQANLSQRWIRRVESDPTALAFALHEALARCSPAPFAAWLGAPDHAIASSSPEGFLRLRRGSVETRPIKGTRPRSEEPAEDARLRAELAASAKDRAENVMIVDVLRNDLGRVCETGTVATTALCELESFAQVHHLTSTVEGRLRSGADAFDLLHACFPGGSITGAPKIRAIEILEGLEPVRRHIYTGAIGYVDFGGDADWNIAIRTALVTPDAVRFSAGGGITADSDPAAEYRETLDKAEGMAQALTRVTGPVFLEPSLASVA